MPERIKPEAAKAFMLTRKLKPLEPYKNALTKWKCKCLRCGTVVYPKYNTIQQGGSGCRTCGLRERNVSNKLPEKEAIQIMLASGLKPLEKYVSMNTPWKSRCLKCKEINYPRLAGLKNGRQGGCKTCGYVKAAEKNRFTQKEAREQLMEFGYRPMEKYKSAHSKWKSRCLQCDNIVYPKLSLLRSGQGGCVYCSNRKVDLGEAKKLLRERKLKPLEPKPNNLRVGWKCKCLRCQRDIKVHLSNLYRGSDPCKYCSGKAVDPATATKTMRKAGLRVLEPYKSSSAKWKAECLKCRRVVYPQYNSIRSGQGGCMYCAEKGMDMNIPSYLYLISNAKYGALKIGIGNILQNMKSDRLQTHLRYEWQLLKKWQFETGAEAYEVEQSVLTYIRVSRNIPQYLTREQMPQRGETETMDIELIDVKQLIRLINRYAAKSNNSIDKI